MVGVLLVSYYVMATQTKFIDKLPGRSEHAEAVALAGYLLMLQRMGKIQLYSHLPHETYTTSWAAKRKNTSEGVKSGVPDYIVITKDKVLFIELKREKGGVVSEEQKLWISNLEGKTTVASVCKGFEASKAFIDLNIV